MKRKVQGKKGKIMVEWDMCRTNLCMMWVEHLGLGKSIPIERISEDSQQGCPVFLIPVYKIPFYNMHLMTVEKTQVIKNYSRFESSVLPVKTAFVIKKYKPT